MSKRRKTYYPVRFGDGWLQQCQKCEYEWKSHDLRPQYCPSCKNKNPHKPYVNGRKKHSKGAGLWQ